MNNIINETIDFDIRLGKPVSSYLIYEDCLKLIIDIGNQLEKLNKKSYGLLYIQKSDILQYNNNYSLKPNLDYFTTANNELLINRPFNNNNTMAPEVKNITEIPAIVSYNVCFFNLKQVAMDIIGLEEFDQLNPTKLYFLLKRCSNKDSSQRVFFYI